MNIGIIGNGSDKFTFLGEFRARKIINDILFEPNKLVSGHSKMKGIDIWGEELAIKKNCFDQKLIMNPKHESQMFYKIRNDQIARFSYDLHIILAKEYPNNYPLNLRFDECYHHYYKTQEGITPKNHVKSGACWTGNMFREYHNKNPIYHIVGNY